MSWDPGWRPNLASTAHMTSEQTESFKSKHTKTEMLPVCMWAIYLYHHFFLIIKEQFFSLYTAHIYDLLLLTKNSISTNFF